MELPLENTNVPDFLMSCPREQQTIKKLCAGRNFFTAGGAGAKQQQHQQPSITMLLFLLLEVLHFQPPRLKEYIIRIFYLTYKLIRNFYHYCQYV